VQPKPGAIICIPIFSANESEGSGMANVDLCVKCNIPRTIVDRERLPKGYEIQSLQCPLCETVVRLAQKREQVRTRESWHPNHRHRRDEAT
jgi:hypothetical protein